MAGWLKMPLGKEVDLDPGDIVLDGDPAPPKKGHSTPLPNFRRMSIVAKRLDGSMPVGTKVDLGTGDIVLDGDPAPPERGTGAPSFWPMSIVAKRSPISATTEHLFLMYEINSNHIYRLHMYQEATNYYYDYYY